MEAQNADFVFNSAASVTRDAGSFPRVRIVHMTLRWVDKLYVSANPPSRPHAGHLQKQSGTPRLLISCCSQEPASQNARHSSHAKGGRGALGFGMTYLVVSWFTIALLKREERGG